MKKPLLIILCVSIFSFAAHAQYDFAEWGIGGSYGTTQSYADMRQNNQERGYGVSLYWNYSPYLPFAFEAQTGKLSGGNDDLDPSKRYFTNNFLAFNLHGDLQLGEITDFQDNFFLSRLKGLYSGIGVGAMFNNVTDVRRIAYNDPNYVFPGKDKSVTLLIPLRFGYEFKVFNYDDMPFMAINFTYTHNLTFAEGMDGYDDPSNKFKNNAQDMFRYISVGIKFNFGNRVPYIKPIH